MRTKAYDAWQDAVKALGENAKETLVLKAKYEAARAEELSATGKNEQASSRFW